jgi:molybdopterin molybdotransferase
MKSTAFFTVKPVEESLALLFQHIEQPHRTEVVPTHQAIGRIVASSPTSPTHLPTFVRSTMDGYAVRAEDTFGASDSLPAYLRLAAPVHMGEKPTHTLQPGEASAIHTGGMLPDGANAVVMIERTQAINDSEIEILGAVAPGENLVQIGEDVEAGSAILPVGHVIRPQDIGGLLAVGILKVTVQAPVRVGIMGSGDEIIAPSQEPTYGQIRDINSYTIAALCEELGAEVTRLGIAPDNYDAIFNMARTGLADADILVISAGSSVSIRDYTRDAINQLGIPGILQHGLAVKPGKPAILAACGGKPVIGLPGNPVSAMLVARQVLTPIIQRQQGRQHQINGTVEATLTANIASTTGREDTVPVLLEAEGGNMKATPLFGKSNLIYTLVNANGLLTIPLNVGGLKAGASVSVIPF